MSKQAYIWEKVFPITMIRVLLGHNLSLEATERRGHNQVLRIGATEETKEERGNRCFQLIHQSEVFDPVLDHHCRLLKRCQTSRDATEPGYSHQELLECKHFPHVL